MSEKFLVAFLLALVIVPSSCSFAQAANSDENKEASNSPTNELLASYQAEQAMAPEWYKRRYKVYASVSGSRVYNQSHGNILLLGLILYPILICSCCCYFKEGETASEFFRELLTACILYSLVCYLLILLLSLLGWWVSYSLIGLFSENEISVPWDFVSFVLHAFCLCFLCIVALTRLVNWIEGRQVVSSPKTKPMPSRVRWVVASMLKAAIVTILTGVASTIGGWIGGGIIFVITTGISAAFGINVSHAQEAK